jgi:hypothetical protein
VDRPPFPLSEGTSFFFTPQAHGALVERPDGSRSPTGVRYVLPDSARLPAGSRVALRSYEPSRGWYTYGSGTVSSDRTQILPDPGVRFRRVMCVYVLMTSAASGKVLGRLLAFLSRSS